MGQYLVSLAITWGHIGSIDFVRDDRSRGWRRR